jgi:hypothetical protein
VRCLRCRMRRLGWLSPWVEPRPHCRRVRSDERRAAEQRSAAVSPRVTPVVSPTQEPRFGRSSTGCHRVSQGVTGCHRVSRGAVMSTRQRVQRHPAGPWVIPVISADRRARSRRWSFHTSVGAPPGRRSASWVQAVQGMSTPAAHVERARLGAPDADSDARTIRRTCTSRSLTY